VRARVKGRDGQYRPAEGGVRSCCAVLAILKCMSTGLRTMRRLSGALRGVSRCVTLPPAERTSLSATRGVAWTTGPSVRTRRPQFTGIGCPARVLAASTDVLPATRRSDQQGFTLRVAGLHQEDGVTAF
jgi:hypothetical protein